MKKKKKSYNSINGAIVLRLIGIVPVSWLFDNRLFKKKKKNSLKQKEGKKWKKKWKEMIQRI